MGHREVKMKKALSIIAVFSLCLGLAVISGCCKKSCKLFGSKNQQIVCGGCGEIKGAAKCCVLDAKKCSKCSLNKGSVGCCKNLPEGTLLCSHCGEVKGSDGCCKEGAVKCSVCGLNKGAPGCCKLKR